MAESSSHTNLPLIGSGKRHSWGKNGEVATPLYLVWQTAWRPSAWDWYILEPSPSVWNQACTIYTEHKEMCVCWGGVVGESLKIDTLCSE